MRQINPFQHQDVSFSRRPEGELEGLYVLKWFDENTHRRRGSKGIEEEQRTDSLQSTRKPMSFRWEWSCAAAACVAAPLGSAALTAPAPSPGGTPAACTLPLGVSHTLWHPDSCSVERSSKQRSGHYWERSPGLYSSENVLNFAEKSLSDCPVWSPLSICAYNRQELRYS